MRQFFSVPEHFSPHIHSQEGEGSHRRAPLRKGVPTYEGEKSLTLGFPVLQMVLHGAFVREKV